MATDIYSMLTGGYDPRAEQMKQQQAFQQQLGQSTTPQSFIATVGSNMGNMLGQGVQKIAGVKDPREEKAIKKREALERVKASGVDMKDQVAFLSAVAQEFQNVGLTAEALQANEAAQSAKVKSYQMKGFENKQLLQEAIAAIPPDASSTDRMNSINNAVRQFGSTDQQTALAKEDVQTAREKKAVNNRVTALISSFGTKMDNNTILSIASDKSLYSKVMEDKYKYREQKTKVITSASGVELVDAVTGKTIKDYGLPTAGVTVNNRQENAEQGARGKMLVNQFEDISKAASQASTIKSTLQTNLKILDNGLKTGFGTNTIAAAASVLSALGLKDAEKYAGNAQMFTASLNQLVLREQQAQKGPQTESDAKRITATTAQLGNEVDANKFILKVAVAQANKTINQRKFYAKWYKDNKTYDGAEDAWFDGEGSKSLFDSTELKEYAGKTQPSVDQIPGGNQQTAPIYATNPQTNQRIMSTDGGKTWQETR